VYNLTCFTSVHLKARIVLCYLDERTIILVGLYTCTKTWGGDHSLDNVAIKLLSACSETL